MKKCTAALLTLTIVLAASLCFAETKIATFNPIMVMEQAEPSKKALADLKAASDPIAKDLERRKNELEKMAEDLQKQRMVLSQEARQDKELEMKRKARDLEDAMTEFQRKFQADRNRLNQPVAKVLEEVIKDFCKKNAISALLIVGPQSPVMWSDESVDVTAQIVQEVNKAAKAKGK